MGKLLYSHREAIRRWADWAEAEVSSWEGTTLDNGAQVPEGVFEEIEAGARRIERSTETEVPRRAKTPQARPFPSEPGTRETDRPSL
jgi:hypothetical protein